MFHKLTIFSQPILGLDIVIDPLIPVHIFIDQPFKCLKWLRGILMNIDYEFSLFILSCFKLMLNDKRRFQQKGNHLELIKTDLDNFEYYKCEDAPVHYKSSWIKFFTGQNSFKGFDKYCYALASVKGLLKTEEEVEIDLVNKLNALRSKKLLHQSENHSEISKRGMLELNTGWVNNRIIPNESFSPPESIATPNQDINRSSEQNKEIVKQFLRPLSGYYHDKKIMTDEEFGRLINNVFFLVEFQCLPKSIIPIIFNAVSVDFVRYTFYLLHKKLYGRRKRQYWIDFLHENFIQFKTWEKETTNKHFATFRGNYEQELKNIRC